jgi:hypothetical protein
MKGLRIRIRPGRPLVALAALVVLLTGLAYAGGPLAINSDGQPYRWPHFEVKGGPLNTDTVDAAGRVVYRVDEGTLGILNHADAVQLVDRIFQLYTDIPTASIEFVNGGPIRDPLTGQPVDVNGNNVGRFLDPDNPTFQNPIIFDSDGSITGGGGVLGFFGFLQADDSTASIEEGFVVLNGAALTGVNALSVTSFLGVFTHEFGHFAGPLDHAQINGNIAARGSGSTVPVGFSSGQAYDLYAPFTETLFPFLFGASFSSTIGAQFPDSGFFIASLDMDTQNSLSNLYPTADYGTDFGSIEGQVFLDFGGSHVPVSGINVVARRIDQGAYPLPAGTQAFLVPPAIDALGVPAVPTPRPETDSLATVSSAVTGLDFGAGTYRIRGLPPGDYMVQIQLINPNAVGGSGIGPLFTQFPLPVGEEYFNGPGGPSSSPSMFVPVTVTAGNVVSGIDFAILGVDPTPPVLLNEKEQNHKLAKAQKLGMPPIELTAAAAFTDNSKLKMVFPDGSSDKIEDLFQIVVPSFKTVFIVLESTSGSGDLDLYLFLPTVNKKKSSFSDPNLLDLSAGPTGNEMITAQLDPGTYIIGVSAFDGNANYKLRIFTSQ